VPMNRRRHCLHVLRKNLTYVNAKLRPKVINLDQLLKIFVKEETYQQFASPLQVGLRLSLRSDHGRCRERTYDCSARSSNMMLKPLALPLLYLTGNFCYLV